jgi:hypothetical protein
MIITHKQRLNIIYFTECTMQCKQNPMVIVREVLIFWL